MLNPYVPGWGTPSKSQPGFRSTKYARPNDFSNIPDYQFAETRLNNMLASNSTFMREAQRRGMEAAGTRGGLNSSIAAGLSTREAIRAAAPIATADAQFTQEDYLTGRRANLDDMLRENDSSRTMQRDNLLGDIRSREMDQAAGITTRRDNLLGEIRSREMDQEADLTARRDSLLGDIRSREMNQEADLTSRRDTLLGDIRSREMNQEADLLGQRDVRLSGLRRQELAFEMDLTQQARDNDVQREAWLTQQNEFTRMYSTAMNDARRTGLGFLDQLGSAFINDPEVFSPEVVSGMSNFFRGLVDGTTNSSVSRLLQDIVGFNTRPQAPTTPVSPGPLPAPPREPERTQPIPSTPFWDI